MIKGVDIDDANNEDVVTMPPISQQGVITVYSPFHYIQVAKPKKVKLFGIYFIIIQ